MNGRTDWGHVLDEARRIVASYDTLVTLRQLFYRLVAAQLIPNLPTAYKSLSNRTAKGRRNGTFPDLVDLTRSIHRHRTWTSPQDATDWLRGVYRRDRTEGQDVSLYLGVEKAGMLAQLDAWFADDAGIPVLPLGGYASQSYVDEVRRDVGAQGPPAVLLYAGDFDPSGEDIARDFVERTACWSAGAFRVALSERQVTDYDLPPQMGKATDSRASAFVERYGRLVQVELDALPPDTLRDLFRSAIGRRWDDETYRAVLEQEATERGQL